MIHIDPASAEFETLPREQRAMILRHQFGWSTRALADELGVSQTTILAWTTPGAKERNRARRAAYCKTEIGRKKRNEMVRRYRANLKARREAA
jgi:hypothetical protein